MPLETAVCFDCEGERLIGVLHSAPPPQASSSAATLGVVVIVGGPQYRAGSHRQFVHLARALAAAGHPVLRFDVRGTGDSTGTPAGFERISPDIGAAISALTAHAPSVRAVALWGLCDAAAAALLYLDQCADRRIVGLCLANPWVRSAALQARAQVKHYYVDRLLDLTFWRKLLRGEVARGAASELVRAIRRARRPVTASAESFQSRMLRGWQGFGGSTLLLLSGNDYTAREFAELIASQPSWRSALASPTVQRHDLPGVDHTFSSTADRATVESLSLRWLSALVAATAPAERSHG